MIFVTFSQLKNTPELFSEVIIYNALFMILVILQEVYIYILLRIALCVCDYFEYFLASEIILIMSNK